MTLRARTDTRSFDEIRTQARCKTAGARFAWRMESKAGGLLRVEPADNLAAAARRKFVRSLSNMLLSAAYDRYRLKLARPAFPGRAVALIHLLSDLLAQPRQPGLVLGDPPTTGPPPVAQCALVTCTLTAAPPLTPAASVVLAGVPTS